VSSRSSRPRGTSSPALRTHPEGLSDESANDIRRCSPRPSASFSARFLLPQTRRQAVDDSVAPVFAARWLSSPRRVLRALSGNQSADGCDDRLADLRRPTSPVYPGRQGALAGSALRVIPRNASSGVLPPCQELEEPTDILNLRPLSTATRCSAGTLARAAGLGGGCTPPARFHEASSVWMRTIAGQGVMLAWNTRSTMCRRVSL